MPPRLAAALALALPLLAVAAVNLDALWDFGQPQASERRFRQAITRAAGDDVLVLRTQLARSLGLQKRFEAAHLELDALESPAQDASAEARVRLWLERGRVYRSAGDPGRGLPLFQRAFELAEAEALQDLAGDALHMVALALPPGEEQMQAHRRMLAWARAASDPKARRWEGVALNNLGDALRQAGDLPQALAVFGASRVVYERQRSPGRERIPRWQLANVLRLLGRLDEALAMQQQLEAEHARGAGRDPYVFDELALLHEARGDAVQAARYRERAAQARAAH